MLKSPGAKEKLSKAGAEMFLKGPDEYAAYVQQDAKRMLPLIDDRGLRRTELGTARPTQSLNTGLRFSAKARCASLVSSLEASATVCDCSKR